MTETDSEMSKKGTGAYKTDDTGEEGPGEVTRAAECQGGPHTPPPGSKAGLGGQSSRSTRIIKGYECPPHSQPWQVALFQKTRLLCGATLIAPKWLLTAAHCRKPWVYVVLLGEHNLQHQDGCEQRRTATESFPHPDFNNSLPNKDHRNDIMLVKMSSPALITGAVRPLTLSSHCVAAGTRCLISGWGTTSSPQVGKLPGSRGLKGKVCQGSPGRGF
uniref:Peptidase S1 domain-containing protein n=1 Tax=Marmota marmota marmota TaxID=9994 RepID=A0A8C5YXP4_MARMA